MALFEDYQHTAFFDFPALEFPAVTEPADVYVANYLSTSHYTISVTVSNIDTSVDIRLEGSLDGINYGSLVSENITANGTYLYHVTGAPVAYLRGNFLSETGGVRAVVKFSIAAN